MKHPNHLWLIAIFSIFISCHLEKLADPDPCALAPRASFELNQLDCDLPCDITINNTTEGADSYEWDFGNGNLSSLEDPAPFSYEAPGQYSIKLKIQSGSCVDSLTQVVTVGSASRFKKSIALGASSIIPLRATQRSDGNYHCIYLSGSNIRSAIVGLLGDIIGTPVTLSGQFISINQTTSYEGGFLLSGTNGATAKAAVINADQTWASAYIKDFQFGSGTSSEAQGIIMNADNELALTGYRLNATPIRPGLARVGITGVTSPVIANASTNDFGGISIVQGQTSGDYIIAGERLNPFGSGNAVLMSVSQNGNLNGSVFSLADMNIVDKIIRLDNGSFALAGRNTALGKAYVYGISFDGVSFSNPWKREIPVANIVDLVNSSSHDGAVVVCGTAGDALYVSKFAASSGTTYIWERSFTDLHGAIGAITIDNTEDGGYLIAGQYDNSGKQEFYLIKTDGEGLTQ